MHELVNGAIVTSGGYYWHYDDTGERPIWRARRGIGWSTPVLKRHRVPSRAAERLQRLWEEKGELREVRDDRKRREFMAPIERLGHFEPVGAGEPLPPFVCILCGCVIAVRYMTNHRKNCNIQPN